jgi:8-oxo-dGTP diphosphatase
MTRAHVRDAVAAIEPWDAREAQDRVATLAWIASGEEIFRIRKPDVPPQHLVSYFVLVDVDAEALLMVDHRNAGLWLPTGGHVEPDEDPHVTVRREAEEELGIEAELLEGLTSNPLFVTVSTTTGNDHGHTDVSLWYVVAASVDQALQPDPGEFHAVEWWPFDRVTEPGARIDPELPRFLEKLRADLVRAGTVKS